MIQNLHPWTILFLASFFEILWAIFLHYSNGFQNIGASVAAIVFAIVSFVLLAFSIKSLPVGVSYAVWTSIGIVGTTIFSSFIDKNSNFSLSNYFFISLILIGVYGLSISTE